MKNRTSIVKGAAVGCLCIVGLCSTTTLIAQHRVQFKESKHSLTKNIDGFERVEALFTKELYAQALAEITALEKEPHSMYESSILGFYKAISSSIMLKEETKPIIERFLQSNDNAIYANIANVILAEAYLESGKTEEAGVLFKSIEVGTLTKNMAQRYNFYYGKYFFETKQYPEAKYRFSQASEVNSGYSDDILYYLSYIKYQNKEYDGAMEGFVKLASKNKFAQANIYIAQIKFQNGDFKYIVDNLDKLQEFSKSEDKGELTRLVGESYYNLSNYPEAIKWMAQYSNNGGEMGREQHYIMGYSYYMNNLYSEAIKHFTQIIKGDDAMVQNAYYHLADSYLKTNDKAGALRAFSMASGMDHNREFAEDALYNHVKLSYEMGGGDIYSQLIELMQRFLDKYPQSKKTEEIRGYLLSVYINTSDYNNAILAIEKVKQPSGAILSALQRMCYTQALEKFSQRDYRESIKLFDKTITYDQSPKYSAVAHYWKAEAMNRLGEENKKVIDLYKKYQSLSTPQVKENQFSNYNIAYIYFNEKSWDVASEWFAKFLKSYPHNDIYSSDANMRLADIKFGRRDYKSAIEGYAYAKSIDPSNADYPDYQTALCWGLSGSNDKKIAQLKTIVEHDSSIYSDLALVELASTYNKNNRYKESEKLLAGFVADSKQSPYHTSALLEMGVATSNQNKNNEALNFYKQVVAAHPTSDEAKDALLAIKSIYVAQGDVTPYFDFMKSVNLAGDIDASQKEQLSFDALQQQYLKNEYKAVIAQSKRYRTEFPKGSHSNDVTYYLAEALFKSGNTNEAIKEFDNIISLPVNQYTTSALSSAEKIYTQKGDKDGILVSNEKMYEASNDQSTKQRALEKMMAIAIEIAEPIKIKSIYEKVLDDKNATKQATSLALFARGREAFKKGDYVTTFADLRKSALPESTIEGAESQYMKAVILFSEKKYADTESLIMSFSKKGTPHQYWLAKSFILLGDTYAARGDLFQAKATYQSIIEGYGSKNDGIVKVAKEKIEKLGTNE